jgi:hypothetical protein
VIATATVVVLAAAVIGLDIVRVGRLYVLRGIFPCVNKGMHAVSLVGTVLRMVTWVRVMLVRLFVPVLPVPMMLVFHRRVSSATVMHAAALCVPFRVPGLRQFLVLVDRSAIKLFSHDAASREM